MSSAESGFFIIAGFRSAFVWAAFATGSVSHALMSAAVSFDPTSSSDPFGLPTPANEGQILQPDEANSAFPLSTFASAAKAGPANTISAAAHTTTVTMRFIVILPPEGEPSIDAERFADRLVGRD